MEKILKLYVNGQLHSRFDAGVTIPGLQRRRLDELDFHMDQGVQLEDAFIINPNQGQRVRFVCGLLQRALHRDQQDAIAGFCLYLVNRAPKLTAIYMVERGERCETKLEFTE